MRNYGGLRSNGGKERECFKRVLNKFLFPGIVGVLISVPVAAALLAYIMRTEQSRKPGKPRLSRFPALLKCKGFGRNCPKTLHLPRERCGAPVEIRIETMAKFHKSGSKEPFLWNCAATAARINRKAVYSVDIIIAPFFLWHKPSHTGNAFIAKGPRLPEVVSGRRGAAF